MRRRTAVLTAVACLFLTLALSVWIGRDSLLYKKEVTVQSMPPEAPIVLFYLETYTPRYQWVRHPMFFRVQLGGPSTNTVSVDRDGVDTIYAADATVRSQWSRETGRATAPPWPHPIPWSKAKVREFVRKGGCTVRTKQSGGR